MVWLITAVLKVLSHGSEKLDTTHQDHGKLSEPQFFGPPPNKQPFAGVDSGGNHTLNSAKDGVSARDSHSLAPKATLEANDTTTTAAGSATIEHTATSTSIPSTPDRPTNSSGTSGTALPAEAPPCSVPNTPEPSAAPGAPSDAPTTTPAAADYSGTSPGSALPAEAPPSSVPSTPEPSAAPGAPSDAPTTTPAAADYSGTSPGSALPAEAPPSSVPNTPEPSAAPGTPSDAPASDPLPKNPPATAITTPTTPPAKPADQPINLATLGATDVPNLRTSLPPTAAFARAGAQPDALPPPDTMPPAATLAVVLVVAIAALLLIVAAVLLNRNWRRRLKVVLGLAGRRPSGFSRNTPGLRTPQAHFHVCGTQPQAVESVYAAVMASRGLVLRQVPEHVLEANHILVTHDVNGGEDSVFAEFKHALLPRASLARPNAPRVLLVAVTGSLPSPSTLEILQNDAPRNTVVVMVADTGDEKRAMKAAKPAFRWASVASVPCELKHFITMAKTRTAR